MYLNSLPSFPLLPAHREICMHDRLMPDHEVCHMKGLSVVISWIFAWSCQCVDATSIDPFKNCAIASGLCYCWQKGYVNIASPLLRRISRLASERCPCAVNCTNRFKAGSGISSHVFPVNEDKRKACIRAVSRDKW